MSGAAGIGRSMSRYYRTNQVGHPARVTSGHGQAPSSQTEARIEPSQRSFASEHADARHAPLSTQLGASDPRTHMHPHNQIRPVHERAPNGQIEALPSQPAQRVHSAQKPSVSDLFPPPQYDSKPAVASPVLADGPPKSGNISATRSTTDLLKLREQNHGGRHCLGLFKRHRAEPESQKQTTPIARAATNEPHRIRSGGVPGASSGIDAPISAVNAGDRKVLVEYGQSRSYHSVDPTTTPVDILKSEAAKQNAGVNAKSAILLESFGKVGIQRPLRQYEHVRDVMNSWDSDEQNVLLLVDPGMGNSEAELSHVGVPKEKPGDESWLMHFSQKPGKWDRRLITLKKDGQITMQKDPRKPQDQVNVCHLSDFDIYTPTPEKLRKKIMPPKKFCYAIKSQQKTSMFLSTEDFVHFFSTPDKRQADEFYATIQRWRSWYLVNVMGAGVKTRSRDGFASHKANGSGLSGHPRHGAFTDHYVQLSSANPAPGAGQLETLVGSPEGRNPQGFTKSSSQFDTTMSPERRTSHLRKQRNTIDSTSKRVQLAGDEPLVNPGCYDSAFGRPSMDHKKGDADEFAATGLLGGSYSRRQRSVEGPNLPISNSQRSSSRRGDSTDLQRSGSRAHEPPFRPLVDLTPQYKEPPQHSKKGKGFRPDVLGPGGLIDNATTPDDPIGAPPSSDWRGRPAPRPAHHHSHSRSRTNHAATRSGPWTATLGASEPQTAFTGEGLLAGAHANAGWGGGDRGRGVMDGTRAKGPMVDLRENSWFAEGSLLQKVEREKATPRVIDREYGHGY